MEPVSEYDLIGAKGELPCQHLIIYQLGTIYVSEQLLYAVYKTSICSLCKFIRKYQRLNEILQDNNFFYIVNIWGTKSAWGQSLAHTECMGSIFGAHRVHGDNLWRT